MEEKKILTYEEIMALFAASEKRMAESDKRMAEHDKRMAEHDKMMAESDKRFAEYKEQSEKEFAELRKLQKESKKEIREMAKEVKRLNNTVCGVEKSNGMMAEESFYNSLNDKKTFGGVHFDEIERNMCDDEDNNEGEYDIVMINGNSICIIETKYRVRPDNVSKLVNKQVKKFKRLYPEYSKYNYYLGIGGMSFTSGVDKKAKELGVGILKLKCDVVEIHDENLQVY